MDNRIRNMFYPNNLCIVGASSKEKSIGYEILKSIANYNYHGNVFPVNPNADEILGYKCYKSILDIKKEIHLAILVVPKKFVNESIDQLIEKGVQSIILITAGFRETGAEGTKKEEEIIEKLKKHNVRMVGPNCMGVINTIEGVRLNATFVAEEPVNGGIGFLSQSGALGAAVLNSLRETDIRFSQFISVGNKADISENDILDFWQEDPNIKTICFYLESITSGLQLVRKFLEAETRKPLIVLKAGKTESGKKAATSHTGALSTNEIITESIFHQFGIIKVDNINELFNTAKGFEYFPIPMGNRIAVVTNAGGPAILAVDKLDQEGLALAEINENTKSILREFVHPEGSINNPIDLLPGGSPEAYKKVNEILCKDVNIDAIISIFVEPVMVNAFNVIESVNSITTDKPIYQVCMPLPEFWNNYRTNSSFKIPIFKNPEDPAEMIANILHYQSHKKFPKLIPLKNYGNNSDLEKAEFLNQKEIEVICRSYNIPIVQNITRNVDENIDLNFEYPVVLKGLHQEVIHKSEFNAVRTNIENIQQLRSEIVNMKSEFNGHGLDLDRFLIQKQIDIKHELLIGGYRDPSFGPIIAFGSGGKYVEILKDVQMRSAFVSDEDLDEMIDNTIIGKIVCGVRGETGIDKMKLKSLIKNIANLLIENDKIIEVDINPLAIDQSSEFHAVDVRIKSI